MNAMRTSILAGLLIALVPVAYAQEIEPDQQYLLLATTKTSTMQKELDEASSQGFRVVVGSPTSGKEMALLLERVTHPHLQKFTPTNCSRLLARAPCRKNSMRLPQRGFACYQIP